MDVDDAMTDVLNKTVTPSHRVPPEIVTKIIQDLLPTKIDYGLLIRERLGVLLTATSICQYWRHAALDHATLWSIVPIDRRSLGELFLQRSRNAPLLIIFDVKTRRCCTAHQAMVSLLPHMQRAKKVRFCAPAPVLNGILSTLNSYMRGAQLEEISIRVDIFPSDEMCRTTLDLLLEHASTLRVLRLEVFKPRFPAHELPQFSHLSHLELLSTHDIHDISPLLASLPVLTSIKARVNAFGGHKDNPRIVPQANLRHIHLLIMCYTPHLVFDALRVPAGVHLRCEMAVHPVHSVDEPHRFLPLSSEFFENTSHIEELRISPPSYSGSGPSGSFCLDDIIVSGFQPPIEDFSHLRKLVVNGAVKQWFLENIVRSAPRLVSVIFVDCTVTRSREFNDGLETMPSLVDPNAFIKAISEEHHLSAGAGGSGGLVINTSLERERLKGFVTLLGNHN